MAQTLIISQAFQLQNSLFLDTRSPAEFAEDHIPGAINLPILSNEERSIVGMLYKQVSPEKALERGKEFFQQKVPRFLQQMEQFKQKNIIVNCWRGGMRSKVIAELLESQGYKAKQLEGGYKQYRKYVREQLEKYELKPKVVVVWGLTCVGKTKLLKQFPHFLNLEELAQHRGSLFGALGLQPRSQKKFESLLLQRLEELQDQPFILVEGESRKIGDVQIPAFLYNAMRSGKHILLKADIDARAQNVVEEYFSEGNIEKIKEITLSLQKVISRQHKQKVVELINQGKYQEAAKVLLQYYYDPLYNHTLGKRGYLLELDCREGKKILERLNEKEVIDRN